MLLNKEIYIDKKDLYWSEFKIIRKKYDSTDSAKYKGKIKFMFDNNGIIYHWEIIFDEIYLDLYTTESWFDEKKSKFKVITLRNELFELLNLEKTEKRSQEKNKIIKLNKDQVIKTNEFIRKINTIPNIIMLLKGNNASGQLKSPSGAELILDDEKTSFKNFVLFFKNYSLKHLERNWFYKNVVKEIYSNENKYQENYFSFLPKRILKIFEKFQEGMKKNEYNGNLKAFKEELKKVRNLNEEIEKDVYKERIVYSKNIENKYQKNYIFNCFVDFEKAHIFPVNTIKKELKNMAINHQDANEFQNKYNYLLKMVSDPNNFLDLEPTLHRFFDKNYFTYSLKGEIEILNNDILQQKTNILQISKIPEKFLKERIKFIELRRQSYTMNKIK